MAAVVQAEKAGRVERLCNFLRPRGSQRKRWKGTYFAEASVEWLYAACPVRASGVLYKYSTVQYSTVQYMPQHVFARLGPKSLSRLYFPDLSGRFQLLDSERYQIQTRCVAPC